MDRYKFTETSTKDKYNFTTYPIVEKTDTDIYIIAPKWTRLDVLADIYYKDVSKWVIIAKANENVIDGDSLSINEPTRLRIPRDSGQFMSGLEDEA